MTIDTLLMDCLAIYALFQIARRYPIAGFLLMLIVMKGKVIYVLALLLGNFYGVWERGDGRIPFTKKKWKGWNGGDGGGGGGDDGDGGPRGPRDPNGGAQEDWRNGQADGAREEERDWEYAGYSTRDEDFSTEDELPEPDKNTSPREWAKRVLGVSKDAGIEECKKAYRKRIALCHPDMHLDADEGEKLLYRNMSQKLNEAKEILDL